MFSKKLLKFAAVGITSIAILAGCSTSEASDSKDKGNSSKVRTVKVAFDQASKPISYIDDQGNPTGYDVEVMKLVDELLPDYKFEYVGTTSDDLLIGVEQGKYQVGVKNAFFTEERTEKFIYPKEFLGLSSAGLVLRKEDENIKSLKDFASAGYSLAPIAANNAQYTVIDEYNKKNPDNKVKLKAGDAFTIDIVQWVNEGRVDGGVMIEGPFNQQVTAKDGAYHKLENDIVYNEFAVIKTWPLYNKKEQKFADAYDKAIKQIKEEQKTNELSKKFYDRDLFEVLEQVER
ncbi:transporter substrate-binding domain-containing protein [Viridibacillus sp. FSL R5-0477]|uniref:Amino-acid ABC transporter extracellular-binding protein ytmK n=1 Tax=Viridibacillus arenosi FSL R5-213 TaxID=1227360 RepID=W4F3S7_9BACL|nr:MULTISPECIES: transporter substrate-binding domain-containing protein [Viridibacillus]ETT87483.1 amino-acid ABC transporter extracellular-binding protein ytmK [Viridibacillus arenosi FSL R5-213]OMC82546.1 amino acid ABC transporter substrate-binding protein [Viridibacillus sp. FSL H8-0123]OMC87712.1 amino acid ABC transporter substrate-binding protein [Viridibacillus sp. FSL H7-0596]OMC91256.1 amino acid ABC transporter substrate-binding protein [Viridibacillus arenosi]